MMVVRSGVIEIGEGCMGGVGLEVIGILVIGEGC